MRAAIYARRSKAQEDRAEETKSTARQVEEARAFALARGWTVLEEWVVEDDGWSGATFDRPGLNRLRDALPRAPFDVIVCSEQKTIGREPDETKFILKRFGQA